MTFPRRHCHIPKLQAWFAPQPAQRRLHGEGFCQAVIRNLKEKPLLFAESIGGTNPGADDRGVSSRIRTTLRRPTRRLRGQACLCLAQGPLPGSPPALPGSGAQEGERGFSSWGKRSVTSQSLSFLGAHWSSESLPGGAGAGLRSSPRDGAQRPSSQLRCPLGAPPWQSQGTHVPGHVPPREGDAPERRPPAHVVYSHTVASYQTATCSSLPFPF